jgi:hypothetical protein
MPPLHGFLLSEEVYTTFDAPDVPITIPFAISNRGETVGTTIPGRGFVLREGAGGPFTPIDFPATGINDRGQIVGISGNPKATPGSERPPCGCRA